MRCFFSVKQQLFVILGLLSELYFEKMITHSDRLLDLYMKALKQEVPACFDCVTVSGFE